MKGRIVSLGGDLHVSHKLASAISDRSASATARRCCCHKIIPCPHPHDRPDDLTVLRDPGAAGLHVTCIGPFDDVLMSQK